MSITTNFIPDIHLHDGHTPSRIDSLIPDVHCLDLHLSGILSVDGKDCVVVQVASSHSGRLEATPSFIGRPLT